MEAKQFDYAAAYGYSILVFSVVLCYSVMAPLITAFGFIYFLLAFFIHRHNLKHASAAHWQSGGKAFAYVYHMLLMALLIFQLVMVGILSLSKFAGSPAVLPLPFITVAYWLFLYITYRDIIHYGAVEGSDRLDWVGLIDYNDMKNGYLQDALVPLGREMKEASAPTEAEAEAEDATEGERRTAFDDEADAFVEGSEPIFGYER